MATLSNNSSSSSTSSSYRFSDKPIKVISPHVRYDTDSITADYSYDTTKVTVDDEGSFLAVTPETSTYTFHTKTSVPKTGLLIVGLGGNNGTTVMAGILANKRNLEWRTKEGLNKPDYFGSITQASTVRLGISPVDGRDIWVPLKNMLPMVHPNDLVIGGWDINNADMAEAMARAEVLPYALQAKLQEEMKTITPMASIYYKDFIASNQEDRANNLIPGTDKAAHLEVIRSDIRNFKETHGLEKVIVLWSANTERYSDVIPEVNGTKEALMASIKASHSEISPSTIFAMASILEGCTYINGSPQNTFVPGVIELAEEKNVYIGGDDFKSGQTKIKSVLVDFLVSAGIKPESIVSYNHLGNNDGKNLSAPKQFRSKEISKSTVVDDMVASNEILYSTPGEHPDHCVVIKYVPRVADSKRAMDEYTSRIFMGGTNTIVMHNTCEDSLLAAPIILDLVILAELAERITIKKDKETEFHRFHPVLSLLSYLLKAPLVPKGTPVVNALFK